MSLTGVDKYSSHYIFRIITPNEKRVTEKKTFRKSVMYAHGGEAQTGAPHFLGTDIVLGVK